MFNDLTRNHSQNIVRTSKSSFPESSPRGKGGKKHRISKSPVKKVSKENINKEKEDGNNDDKRRMELGHYLTANPY